MPLHRLYELIAQEDAASAHARYDALVGQMTSFARAVERLRALAVPPDFSVIPISIRRCCGPRWNGRWGGKLNHE